MKRAGPFVALGLSILLLVGAGAALATAWVSERQARTTMDGAIRLREAQVAVARAERKVGGSDIEKALASINSSNVIAGRIGKLTAQIVLVLEPTARTAIQSFSLARRGARGAAESKRLIQSVADALAAIASYQESGSASAEVTNAALRRILRSLRRTNRTFPGP